MELGYAFLYLALVFAVVDVLMLMSEEGWKNRAAGVLASLLVMASFFLLFYYFMSNNFLIEYVWSYSSKDLDPLYKAAAIWAGAEGSLLFWASLIYAQYFYVRLRLRPSEEARRVYFATAVIGVFLLALVTTSDVFKRTPDIYLLPQHMPEGFGLNPMLRNFWMVLHPLTIFLGYAFTTIPFAIAMTKLSMGKERIFPEHERMFMRNAWLFLSLGNILGGVWAYEALGWGGYWAWDPLETASLLPWIAVTAYFHARPIRKLLGRGIEITTVTSFLLVLFAALVTRGGIVQTIHGFAAGPTQIGYALLTVMVMIGVAMLFLVLAFKGKRRRRKRYYLKPEISLETLYFLAFVSLILITIVCFVGVLRNFKVEQYNTLTFPLTIVFIFAATGCVLTTYLKPSQIGTLWIASLAAGVGSLAMGITGNRLADFGLPIVAASLMAVVYSIYRDFAAVRRKMLVFGKVCQRFLHVGLLITLIGVLLSSTLAPALPTRVFLFLGERSQVEGTNFALELEDSNAQGWGEVVSPHRTEYFEGEIHLAVYEAGRLVGRGTISMVNDPRWGWYSSVYVHRFPTIDLYVHGISPDLVFLSEDLTLIVATQVDVFVNPYVNIVWIGCALMFVSVIPLIKQSIDRIKG